MKYKYPRISNSLTYERINDQSFRVFDHSTDEEYILGAYVTDFARRLDGYTDPYSISAEFEREEVDGLLEFLDENLLVRYSDVMRLSFAMVIKRLWEPKASPLCRLIAYIINSFLMIFWLPALIGGAVAFFKLYHGIEHDWWWVGLVIGLILGVTLHEMGHLLAAIAYNAPVFEVGVMITYCIIPGAYVFMDDNTVKNRMQRIQISGAGVQMNALLCGLFLLIGAVMPFLNGICFYAAAVNLLLGAFNLLLVKGFDGAAIVSELFATTDIFDKAKKIVLNKKARKRVLSRGISGYAAVTACYLLFALQIALPVFLILNVLEVIECFV